MLGDLDNDGVGDLWVSESGGFRNVYLNSDGTVKRSVKFTASTSFGSNGALLGDLDDDGVLDIAVGGPGDDDGGTNRGAVWIVFMNADGTEKSRTKISALTGGFTGQLEDGDEFGQSVTPVGDRNGDGIPDLVVGAEHADAPHCTSGVNNECEDKDTGEVWILHLNRNGTVQSHELIRSGSDNFTTIRKNANLGQAVTFLGDLDGDGINDIATSADGDLDCATCSNNKGVMTGAVYVLFLQGSAPPGSNQAPVLTNINNQTVTEGNLLTIPVMATDGDGPTPLRLSVTGAPADSSFTDFGDGIGMFSWTPSMGAAGSSPYSVTFRATEDDGNGLSDTQTVMIFVNPIGGGGPTDVYEFEDLTITNSDGTTSFVQSKSSSGASNGQYFLYKSNAIGEFVTFPISVSAPGTYNLDLQYSLAPARGTFLVEVSDNPNSGYVEIDRQNMTVPSGSSFAFESLPMMATFSSAGTHYLRFRVTGTNPDTGSERMGLDKIDVTSQGGGGNQAPMLMNINNQTVNELDALTIPVMATDNDGDPLILAATIVDKDGATVMDANFTDSGGGIGEFMWTPDMDAADLSPYSVTFTATEAAGMGPLSDSETISITVLPFGTVSGNLSANLTPFTAGSVNLTAQGTTDWTHWKGGSINFIHKDNVTLQISNYTLIGSEAPTSSGSKTTYSWTDGTPVESDNNRTAIRVFNVGSGFRVTVPADTTARTLNLYVGAKNARGQFTATLSDGSAAAFSTLINQPSGLGTHLVTLNYMAASAGQTLTIDYTMETRYKTNLMKSQINLEAATGNN